MSTDRILFRPFVAWPHKPTPDWKRVKWPTSSKARESLTVTRALDMVARELRLMGCDRTAYIEVDVDEKHIRLDGELRSNAVPRSPGCIISATHRTLGNLRWANDGYTRLEFNLRAIAATIESLRAVERYGCVRDNEQFRGFKAVESKSSAVDEARARAIGVITKYSGVRFTNDVNGQHPVVIEAIRAAKNATHPDRNNGDHTKWRELEANARFLGWWP